MVAVWRGCVNKDMQPDIKNMKLEDQTCKPNEKGEDACAYLCDTDKCNIAALPVSLQSSTLSFSVITAIINIIIHLQ